MTDDELEAQANGLARALVTRVTERGEQPEVSLAVFLVAIDATERALVALTPIHSDTPELILRAREQAKRVIAKSLPRHDAARERADAEHGIKRGPAS